MKFFIDSADINEVREANKRISLDGVTTNPTLISKVGLPFKETILNICREVNGPVSAEVVALDADGMYREGKELAKIHDNVMVKIPLTDEGLIAVRRFAADRIKTNVTLCFSPVQALLVAKAGASVVSPFVGRLDDIGQNGMELIAQIRNIFDNYDFPTEILVASIRHPIHIAESAEIGADIVTVPFKVLGQLTKHPLTDNGIKQFLKDWESAKKD